MKYLLEQQENAELDAVTMRYRSGEISTDEAQEQMLLVREKYERIRRKKNGIG